METLVLAIASLLALVSIVTLIIAIIEVLFEKSKAKKEDCFSPKHRCDC